MLVSNSLKQGMRLVEEIGASLRLGELKGPYNAKRYKSIHYYHQGTIEKYSHNDEAYQKNKVFKRKASKI